MLVVDGEVKSWFSDVVGPEDTKVLGFMMVSPPPVFPKQSYKVTVLTVFIKVP